jgi:hypothetical protein
MYMPHDREEAQSRNEMTDITGTSLYTDTDIASQMTPQGRKPVSRAAMLKDEIRNLKKQLTQLNNK